MYYRAVAETIFTADNSLQLENFLNPPFFIQTPTALPEGTKQYSSLITGCKFCKKF